MSDHIETLTHKTTKWAGTTTGLGAAAVSIAIWFVIGHAYNYSNGWENTLSIYIGIITFFMIFLIQRSQNKEFQALQLKLNELISATNGADNNLINVEDLTEQEIKDAHKLHDEVKDRSHNNELEPNAYG